MQMRKQPTVRRTICRPFDEAHFDKCVVQRDEAGTVRILERSPDFASIDNQRLGQTECLCISELAQVSRLGEDEFGYARASKETEQWKETIIRAGLPLCVGQPTREFRHRERFTPNRIFRRFRNGEAHAGKRIREPIFEREPCKPRPDGTSISEADRRLRHAG